MATKCSRLRVVVLISHIVCVECGLASVEECSIGIRKARREESRERSRGCGSSIVQIFPLIIYNASWSGEFVPGADIRLRD